MINVHHLPERLEEAARDVCPSGLELHFSRERELLDTGGGIRRVADFLRQSDPCLILGGDMILDADLGALLTRHRERGDAVTMLLRDDPRMARFGGVGVDARGCVRRIGSRHDRGGESRAGIYTWANAVASRAFDTLPDREVFSHFDGWLAPLLAAGARDIRGEFQHGGLWEPVGTLPEYLRANLELAPLSFMDPESRALERGVRFEPGQVIGAGATIGAGASLQRVVIWEGEHVAAGTRARDGVFAGGAFHPAGPSVQ
jgi:NDP-sugar pyrophosphorylase family protein